MRRVPHDRYSSSGMPRAPRPRPPAVSSSCARAGASSARAAIDAALARADDLLRELSSTRAELDSVAAHAPAPWPWPGLDTVAAGAVATAFAADALAPSDLAPQSPQPLPAHERLAATLRLLEGAVSRTTVALHARDDGAQREEQRRH
jgi:hypothetical protein